MGRKGKKNRSGRHPDRAPQSGLSGTEALSPEKVDKLLGSPPKELGAFAINLPSQGRTSVPRKTGKKPDSRKPRRPENIDWQDVPRQVEPKETPEKPPVKDFQGKFGGVKPSMLQRKTTAPRTNGEQLAASGELPRSVVEGVVTISLGEEIVVEQPAPQIAFPEEAQG